MGSIGLIGLINIGNGLGMGSFGLIGLIGLIDIGLNSVWSQEILMYLTDSNYSLIWFINNKHEDLV